MIEYYNDKICFSKKWLTDFVMSEANYYKLLRRGQIELAKRGGGADNSSLIYYDTMPERFKRKIRALLGKDPHEETTKSALKDMIVEDEKARAYFREYVMDNGDHLPESAQEEYTMNASVLNAIHLVLTDRVAGRKAINGKLKGVWPKLAKAVVDLDKSVLKHSLPPYPKFDAEGNQLPLSATAHRRLQDVYRKYKALDNSRFSRIGYESLIHGNWCNKNSEKINDDAKIWLLSRWTSMVNRIATEKQLLREYNELAGAQGWKPLKSVDAIHRFLYEPEII